MVLVNESSGCDLDPLAASSNSRCAGLPIGFGHITLDINCLTLLERSHDRALFSEVKGTNLAEVATTFHSE